MIQEARLKRELEAAVTAGNHRATARLGQELEVLRVKDLKDKLACALHAQDFVEVRSIAEKLDGIDTAGLEEQSPMSIAELDVWSPLDQSHIAPGSPSPGPRGPVQLDQCDELSPEQLAAIRQEQDEVTKSAAGLAATEAVAAFENQASWTHSLCAQLEAINHKDRSQGPASTPTLGTPPSLVSSCDSSTKAQPSGVTDRAVCIGAQESQYTTHGGSGQDVANPHNVRRSPSQSPSGRHQPWDILPDILPESEAAGKQPDAVRADSRANSHANGAVQARIPGKHSSEVSSASEAPTAAAETPTPTPTPTRAEVQARTQTRQMYEAVLSSANCPEMLQALGTTASERSRVCRQAGVVAGWAEGQVRSATMHQQCTRAQPL